MRLLGSAVLLLAAYSNASALHGKRQDDTFGLESEDGDVSSASPEPQPTIGLREDIPTSSGHDALPLPMPAPESSDAAGEPPEESNPTSPIRSENDVSSGSPSSSNPDDRDDTSGSDDSLSRRSTEATFTSEHSPDSTQVSPQSPSTSLPSSTNSSSSQQSSSSSPSDSTDDDASSASSSPPSPALPPASSVSEEEPPISFTSISYPPLPPGSEIPQDNDSIVWPTSWVTYSLPPLGPGTETGRNDNFPLQTGCTPLPPGSTPVTYSIIYTSTTTFYGKPEDYTPPYPAITTPMMCPPPDIDTAPDPVTTTVCSTVSGRERCTTTTVDDPFFTWPSDTVTFVTTDKNPTVVYAPMSTPGYGRGGTVDGGLKSADHKAPAGGRTQNGPQNVKPPPTPTFTVTVAPTKVIIGDKTISVRSTETTKVTISDQTFTINPSQVIGGGTTIQRPWHGVSSRDGGEKVGEGVTTHVGNIPVVIAPSGQASVAVIGGTTFSLPSDGSPITLVVDGTTVTMDETALHFPSSTLPMMRDADAKTTEPAATLTERVVVGGVMVTAFGKSVAVIRETTITYGPGKPALFQTIDDDTVAVESSGVVIKTVTMGGPKAASTDTAYEVVGGVTITQIGLSVVEIKGTTWTVGPDGMDEVITTEVGGQNITVGPDGVQVSTLSLPYPFGPTIITTIEAPPPTATRPSLPAETEEDNGARGSGGDLGSAMRLTAGLGIAIGVWNLRYLL